MGRAWSSPWRRFRWLSLGRGGKYEVVLAISHRACGRDRPGKVGHQISMTIMRPPQHGQGGGSWSEEVAPELSLLACAVRGDGTLRAHRQSSSLSARWPLANRP